MRIRSISELQEHLDDDIAWRRKELTTIFLLVSGANNHQESIYIRGAMILLYAHWEGYIKNATLAYLSYISFIGKPYNTLKKNFVTLGVQNSATISGSFSGFNSYEKITNFFSENMTDNFKVIPEKVIDTESNLNSTVLKEIFKKTGLQYTPDFELNEKRIDEKLLRYRNKIAHGERSYDTDELKEAFSELKELILRLLDNIKEQIINSVEKKLYLEEKNGDNSL